jgi:hypothetical protein
MSKDTTLLSVPAKALSTGSREKLLRRSAADFSGWWCVFHVGHGGGPNRCNASRVALWARSPRTIFTKSRSDQGFATSTRSAVIRSASPSPQCNCTRRRQFVGTGSCACKCRIRRFSHRSRLLALRPLIRSRRIIYWVTYSSVSPLQVARRNA